MPSRIKRFYEFGDFRLDAEKRVLWCGGEIVGLPPKATEVLLLLVEHHGNLVEREELLEKVWQDTFVEEGNLNHAISALRKTLGETGIIQTVPRRGYRFTTDVREVFDENGNDLVIEKHTLSHTLVEEHEEVEDPDEKQILQSAALPTATKRTFSSQRIIYLVAFTGLMTFLLTGEFWFFRTNRTTDKSMATKDSPKTLAILPLQSLNNEDDRAFGLGITESLVSRLGNLQQLVIRPTQSVKRLTETEEDPLEIGRKLKSDVVMMGSFQRADGRIRVTVRLLRVADSSQIWAGSFDETETDIFKLQDTLSAQVAESLIAKLTLQQQQQITSRPTEDFEAYKLYLRGRYAWNKRTPEGLRQSIELYQAAIDRDPTFAHAYAGLSDSYSLLGDFLVLAPHDAYPKAKAAATKALEINNNIAEAHTSLAWILQTYYWDWVGAEREYKRAIELNPNYATAHQWYAEFLMAMGQHQEAISEIRRAKGIDPLSMIINAVEGWVLYHARDYDRSIEQYRKTIELEPNFPSLWTFLARIYEHKGDYANAIAAHGRSIELAGGNAAEQVALQKAYAELGVKGYWQKRLELLQKQEGRKPILFYEMAEISARLGDKEKAFALLEKSCQKREYAIINLKVAPSFDSLRGDLRFQEILRKMNLPE